MAKRARGHREDAELFKRVIMSFVVQLIIRAIDVLLRWPDRGLW
jgi:hypothetical protein